MKIFSAELPIIKKILETRPKHLPTQKNKVHYSLSTQYCLGYYFQKERL